MDKSDLIMQAGRILNPINLDDIAQQYKRRVLDIISKMQFKLVVFDFDGTLVEFKYADRTLLPCKEDELYEYSKTNNIYENVNVLRTMQYIINELNPENVYILTSTRETLIENKNKVIAKEFPTILKEHIIHTNGSKEKVQVLQDLYKEYSKDIIFVEDMAPTIQLVDETGYMTYVYGIHISSFLV